MLQSIPILAWILTGGCLVSALVALWCLVPWRRAARLDAEPVAVPPEDAGLPEESALTPELPRLTVVVYTEGDEEEIDACVATLRDQDYPGLQIVVVTRATAGGRELLAARYAELPDVYVTFIPTGCHNLSERKLSITLGLKAAEGDIVLTTTSSIRPASRYWLRDMAASFADPEVEMVLGYSHLDFSKMKGPRRWFRQFDTVSSAAQWIGYALDGKPYRGDGYNLAFRRDAFFRNKGYAHSMFLHYGEDDLFVTEIANGRNTRVAVNSNTLLTVDWGEHTDLAWEQRKSRYQFTARWLPRAPFARAGALSLTNWLCLLCAAGASLAAMPAWWPAIVNGVIWLLLQGAIIATYRPVAHLLGAVRLWFALPLFMLARPVSNCLFRMEHRAMNKVNYTWQR